MLSIIPMLLTWSCWVIYCFGLAVHRFIIPIASRLLRTVYLCWSSLASVLNSISDYREKKREEKRFQQDVRNVWFRAGRRAEICVQGNHPHLHLPSTMQRGCSKKGTQKPDLWVWPSFVLFKTLGPCSKNKNTSLHEARRLLIFINKNLHEL